MAKRESEMPECQKTVLFKWFIFLLLQIRENSAFECRVDQYTKDGACRECMSTCVKCISELLCIECKAGFFGDVCTKNCSEGCLQKRCNKETGDCLSCEKGYYSKERCERCPENCTECLNADKCTACKTGFTGSICRKLCVNCKPDSECSLEEGICYDGCKDGYRGVRCLERCSSNCLSCHRLDTKNCISCVGGRYGSSCEKPCSTKCKDNSCSKETGSCTHGCQNGFWGDQCEYACPVNCRDGKCLRSSGTCVDGCLGNFTGTKCLCPSTCDCDVDGNCIKCNDNTGYLCDRQCKSRCINNICSMDTETKCFYGCRDEYGGRWCNPFVKDLETEDNKTIVICVLVVVGGLVCFFGVTVCIKRRKAWLSDGTPLATIQSCAEDCSTVASGMCNRRYPVSCQESEKPSNIGKQYGDQYEEENGHEYATLLETCCEQSKETQTREVILSGQQPAEMRSSSAEKSSEQSGGPTAQETGSEEVSSEESFRGHITVDVNPEKGTVQLSKQSKQVSLRTKIPLKKLENLEEDEIRSEFKKLSACTEIQEKDETNAYELLKLSSVAKEYHDSLNACYIDGYKKTEAYIACASPGPKDKKLFWSMVWDEGCDRIVLLTDGDVDKQDEHYWPEPGDCFIREDLTVKCLSHDDYEDFTQRKFEIKRKTDERIVLQLHFTAWPENFARMSADNLMEFQKYRETLTSEKAVPVIVHCSDGIGRTGTYIAFESLIQEGKATGSVDVFACVKRLRERRSLTQKLRKHGKTMVQNYVQYYFLYKALQRWFKQDQQGYKRLQVVSRQTIDSSYEPVEPERENPFSMFQLLHALDIPKDQNYVF